MPQPKFAALAVSLLVVALAGCQSNRFNPPPQQSAPPPLTPAPSGTVTGNQLPPPSAPSDQSQFPDAPGNDQMAALDPSVGTDTGGEVSQNSLLGSWNVQSQGSSCQMFLTLTKYGDSSRGGTRGCSNELADMRSWELAGRQVVVYDDSGNRLAQFSPGGDQRFNGQTTNGVPVSLSR
ncbi:protease inhibitor Inh/omp19 family protein [Chelativorans sp. YIM 93263]|uniref:protease inhibitor Inh/omp19 family protein n=1 Tax=Chelativorans sp. YIM 93263 TaxID=2906648 RepID=UPI00237865E3|nr:protease inhibitor Inh/omp19 family protein [Chelativorans sp. YIM 93263]